MSTPTLTVARARGLGDIPTEHLEAEICSLASNLAAALCRWLLLVAEYDARGAWTQVYGMRSCAHWLSWQCGLSLSTARHHVTVGRRLRELPQITEAFAAGELSFSKVRALVRIATPESEEQLVELARHATASQLERIVRSYRTAVRGSTTRDPEPEPRCYVRYHYDDNGDLVGTFRVAAADAPTFVAAMSAEMARRCPAGQHRPAHHTHVAPGSEAEFDAEADDPFSPPNPLVVAVEREEERAEAFVTIMRRSLETEPVAMWTTASAANVVVHVTPEHLAGRAELLQTRLPRLDLGVTVAQDAARMLCCDAKIAVAVEDADGQPLHLGRSSRDPNAAQRRALLARDRGRCRFPGCHQRVYLHAHHIVFWADGGDTCIDNLILLCSHHHRAIHLHGFTVTGPAQAVFRRPNGSILPTSGTTPPVPARDADLASLNANAGAAVNPMGCDSLSRGDRYDLALTIDALLGILKPSLN